MLTINLVFILRKSVNYSVNLFSNRNMNSASVANPWHEEDKRRDIFGIKTAIIISWSAHVYLDDP